MPARLAHIDTRTGGALEAFPPSLLTIPSSELSLFRPLHRGAENTPGPPRSVNAVKHCALLCLGGAYVRSGQLAPHPTVIKVSISSRAAEALPRPFAPQTDIFYAEASMLCALPLTVCPAQSPELYTSAAQRDEPPHSASVTETYPDVDRYYILFPCAHDINSFHLVQLVHRRAARSCARHFCSAHRSARLRNAKNTSLRVHSWRASRHSRSL
ncbi:hypothetical protein B0H15DRAFT_86007 [Mycena belliarum]|uniref:Uncharacterized protein n=1 Tax=Mycena belliarum TaxID=1033014 RepID=A0AAD6XGL8_9AGAR|nr:hypothetical protein B0H15DRAFT_86007 [Mycena belliae]